jgi:hypothetical protein
MIIAYGISFLRGFLIVLSIREAYCSYLNGNQGLGSRFGPHPKAKGAVDGQVCFHPFIALFVEVR